jgi:hypothetical protein
MNTGRKVTPGADLLDIYLKTVMFRTHLMIEEYNLLGYNVLYSVECQPTFRRKLSPPSSGSKKNKLSKNQLDQVDTQRTTRRYIPEDCTLHNHRCENLRSYI